MSDPRLHITARAHDDALSIAEYLALNHITAAEHFMRALERTYSLLSSNPLIGNSADINLLDYPTTRKFLVDGYSTFIIYYIPTSNTGDKNSDKGVFILRVLHTSRDHDEVM